MRFLGVDLGWSTGPTGLCCLGWENDRLQLLALERLSALDDILDWCDRYTTPDLPAGIAVDAPTIIPNATGMRVPDRLAHKFFSRYHAGCYPANLGRSFAARTIAFGTSLEAQGFVHADAIAPRRPQRFQIEVFPHAATVQLFRLDRICKYKRGRLSDRKRELARLRGYIADVLPVLELPLDFASSPVALPDDFADLTGAALKASEDRLDAVICAYVAAHWWWWGRARTQVLGDIKSGYIVVPLASDRATDEPRQADAAAVP
ncbi:hypothetical protein KR51_00027510 [Rubidibacter lacunae KORDI 51-2]|uniref:DUF429 domain-containing protein n=1 Tax=Rubidibacter lacunae KORDI 51-2 TaxID=582515 RepID=U5DIJ6_9CHRO|nr:hypothetical protein KR51_00027510 [Rubidibacter lacunae KORDI 51-2]